jgi:hypothetical protein
MYDMPLDAQRHFRTIQPGQSMLKQLRLNSHTLLIRDTRAGGGRFVFQNHFNLSF